MLALLGGGAPQAAEPGEAKRTCIVVFSGNRGLCGGFNAELLGFFAEILREEAEPPLIIACGRVAEAFCKERGVEAKSFELSDIPTYDETLAISSYAGELYDSGAVARVVLVYQSFKNTLTQTPALRELLPGQNEGEAGEEAGEALLLPDAETVRAGLGALCFNAAVYSIALENATGAEAATLMAMRSAYDNAKESALKLETAINRQRQAEVTSSVIETAADNAQ